MKGWRQRIGAGFAALALGAQPGLGFAQNSPSAQVSNAPQGGFVLKMNAELVLTNVVARDTKTGELVRGLKKSDFSIFENGKQQQVSTFDFETVEMATPLNEATVSGLATGSSGNKAVVVAKPEDLRNHRLIVMFFDLTSMQPEDLDRSVAAAQEFLRNKMQLADLVALISLGNTLKVDQDFTADKIVIDEAPAEEGMTDYTQYVDPKYAEKIMAESLSMADEPVAVSPRKGPASETAEPAAEPAATESGH